MKNQKNIVLYEPAYSVRFVLEKSLSRFQEEISIFSSYRIKELQQQISKDNVDLLIADISEFISPGIRLSRYGRRHHSDLKIIWLSVLGCDRLSALKIDIGNIVCLEKPLDIVDFRRNVLRILNLLI